MFVLPQLGGMGGEHVQSNLKFSNRSRQTLISVSSTLWPSNTWQQRLGYIFWEFLGNETRLIWRGMLRQPWTRTGNTCYREVTPLHCYCKRGVTQLWDHGPDLTQEELHKWYPKVLYFLRSSKQSPRHKQKLELCSLSPRANYIDRATTACRRS
jgi:hypothetical protein